MTGNRPQTLTELKERFPESAVRFEAAPSGLVKLEIESAAAQGEVFLHGAHVTKYRPADGSDILWMSQHSWHEAGKPIRGGVPICFPWFGPHSSDPKAPSHGLARTAIWQLTEVEHSQRDGVSLTLENTIGAFQLEYRVAFGAALLLSLRVRLAEPRDSSANFEAALHTYLSIGDIKQARIEGLEAASFIDKVDEGNLKPASGEPIQFSGECDRVYLDAPGPCNLYDPVLNRRIEVATSGSRNTVVWNPWIAKSARMPDFGNEEWPSMVCIETANVGEAAVQLSADETHEMTATLRQFDLDGDR